MKGGLLALHCNSPLAPQAEEYITQKRALGAKCRGEVETLNMFDAFCVGQALHEPVLSQDLFDSWCQKRPHEKGATHAARVRYIYRFSAFLANNNICPAILCPPLPRKEKTFVPYIFSHNEIERFLQQVDKTKPAWHRDKPSLAHLSMPILFRMLYCCGLRIEEALRLQTKDVDLEHGVLRLRITKGNRERLVPMSETLTQKCVQYRAEPAVQKSDSIYFFPASDGTYYATSTVYARFRDYLFAAGIGHGGRGKGPRLHDFRHTFAVHTLNAWSTQGKDLYVALPIMMTYLGHSNLRATEKYLRLTEEAHAQIREPFENRFGEVFPEVCCEDE